MKKRLVPTRHLVAGYTALYAPSTPAKRREADRLGKAWCKQVERGVPRDSVEDGTSGRCPRFETTPAGEARFTSVAGVVGTEWTGADGDIPLGDSPTLSDAA